MNLESCSPKLQKRIEMQIVHDLALAQERRDAIVTSKSNQDATAMPPDAAQPCQCDLCQHQREARAADTLPAALAAGVEVAAIDEPSASGEAAAGIVGDDNKKAINGKAEIGCEAMST